MNKTTGLITALVILIACTAYFLAPRLPSVFGLPSFFTITIHENSSSSGGDRYTDETFTFRANRLIAGTATYYSGAGGGCTENCNHTEQCMVVNNQWVEIGPVWQGCQAHFGNVPTKQSLEDDIRSKKLRYGNSLNCRHLDTCYQI